MLAFWWRPSLVVLGLALFSFLFFDAAADNSAWLVFSGGLLIYLVYQLRQLRKFFLWLDNPSAPPPQHDSIWGDAFYQLGKLLRNRQGEQQKVSADLEQMLEATRNLPDGVVILDNSNRITWLNSAAESLLGLMPKRDFGQFILYLLRHSRFSEWLQREDYAQLLIIDFPNGKEKTLALQLIPLPRLQKMMIARDITEIARVETMRRDFVANVSHELRTPITVIVGFLEAFEDMPEPDPVQFRKHIPLMREQSDRIRRLVDDLLTLARLESEPETKDETVDIVTLAHRLANEANTISQGKHTIDLIINNQARLIGNSQELYSAFANLVSNAIRYTPNGGRIGIKWSISEKDEHVFSVQDSGEGIEAQHIPRLTERFYRVDRGRSRSSGGTGLGLAIVKHILQRHQARLRIESTIGKGSTFSASFPLERVIPTTETTSETDI